MENLGYWPVLYFLCFLPLALLAVLIRWRLAVWIEKFEPEVLLRVGWLVSVPLGAIDGQPAHQIRKTRYIDSKFFWWGLPLPRADFPREWWLCQVFRILSVLLSIGFTGWIVLWSVLQPDFWPVSIMFVGGLVAGTVWQVWRTGPWTGMLDISDPRSRWRWDKAMGR